MLGRTEVDCDEALAFAKSAKSFWAYQVELNAGEPLEELTRKELVEIHRDATRLEGLLQFAGEQSACLMKPSAPEYQTVRGRFDDVLDATATLWSSTRLRNPPAWKDEISGRVVDVAPGGQSEVRMIAERLDHRKRFVVSGLPLDELEWLCLLYRPKTWREIGLRTKEEASTGHRWHREIPSAFIETSVC